jgi:hypothetical protein
LRNWKAGSTRYRESLAKAGATSRFVGMCRMPLKAKHWLSWQPGPSTTLIHHLKMLLGSIDSGMHQLYEFRA